MKKIKKIKVLPFAQFQSFMMGLVGFLFGIIYAFGGLIIDTLVTLGWLSADSMSTGGLSYGTVLAFGALIGMPLIGMAVGFAVGIVEAMIYNIVVRWFGGLTLVFEERE